MRLEGVGVGGRVVSALAPNHGRRRRRRRRRWRWRRRAALRKYKNEVVELRVPSVVPTEPRRAPRPPGALSGASARPPPLARPARPLRPPLSMAQPPSLDHAQKLSQVDFLRVSLLWRSLREAWVSSPVGRGRCPGSEQPAGAASVGSPRGPWVQAWGIAALGDPRLA